MAVNEAVLLQSMLLMQMPTCLASQTNNFLGHISNLAPVSSSFYTAHVFCMSFSCREWNMFLKNVFLFVNCCGIWKGCIRKHLNKFMTVLVVNLSEHRDLTTSVTMKMVGSR